MITGKVVLYLYVIYISIWLHIYNIQHIYLYLVRNLAKLFHSIAAPVSILVPCRDPKLTLASQTGAHPAGQP